MKILYLDLSMGASGDMILAALYGLLSEGKKQEFKDKMNSLKLQGTSLIIENIVKMGVSGYKSRVLINGVEEESLDYNRQVHHHHGHSHHHEEDHSHHHHEHRKLKDINSIVEEFDLSKKVKDDIKRVYGIIARAESKVHNVSVEEIHFHEVGQLDAIMDITAVSLLIEMLKVDKILTSRVTLGSGFVKCAHGILPVPAPATALIIEGMEVAEGDILGELLTPTGAALIAHFSHDFSKLPSMKIKASSFGFGSKDFEKLNALRAYLGETPEEKENEDKVFLIEANIDDMTGEHFSHIGDDLLKAGALDIWMNQVIMKKGRPGIILSLLVNKEDLDRICGLIFKLTTTIGLRYCEYERKTLDRKVEGVVIDQEEYRVKVSEGYGVKKIKAEADDVYKLKEKSDVSFIEASNLILMEFNKIKE